MRKEENCFVLRNKTMNQCIIRCKQQSNNWSHYIESKFTSVYLSEKRAQKRSLFTQFELYLLNINEY